MSNKRERPCKICGDTACYSYYGAVACQSCKVFFRRNVENRQKTLKCHFDGHCDVNILSRRVCSACRLEKCFQVGMSTDLVRGSQTGKKKKDTGSSTPLRPKNRLNERPLQIATLNLLEQDQSLLSTDQWNHISNLIHSYENHDTSPAVNDIVKELDSLPPKLRFKIDSNKIVDIMKVLCRTVEPFIQSNQDFISLPLDDRSIVLRGAIDNVSCFSGCFLLRQSGLISNSAVRHGLEITYGSIPYNLTLNVIALLDEDVNLIRLALSLVAFCTSFPTVFDGNISSTHLNDIQSFLRVQNLYAELIWKYLLYTNTFKQAVLRFSHLVKSLCAVITVRTHLQTVKHHTDLVDTITQKIEQQINIGEN